MQLLIATGLWNVDAERSFIESKLVLTSEITRMSCTSFDGCRSLSFPRSQFDNNPTKFPKAYHLIKVLVMQ